jgi:hypothetical protein
MVDEVEQAVVGPVQVLEDEDERALLGQALEEATPGSEGLGPALTSRGRLLAEPDERLEMGYEPFELRGVGDVPHRAAQLLLGDVARIGLEDSGLGFDDLGESPERHALAVRERASLPPEDEIGIGLDGVQELVDEAALADAGHPDEREELGRAILARPRERSPEEVELLRSADESRAGLPRDVDAEAGPCLDRFPDRQRLGLALDQHGLSLAVDDRPLGSAVGRLPDEDSVDGRGCLEAGGGVDDVPGGHALPLGQARAQGHERLPGRDPHPQLELLLGRDVADRERCPHGSLGVVLVRDGRAEERHDRVPDEFLHRAAVPLELGANPRVVGPQDRLHVLRIERLRPRGEAHEVAEEDGDDLSLAASLARHGGESTTWAASSLTSWRASRTRRYETSAPPPTWSRSSPGGRSCAGLRAPATRDAARSTRSGRRASR